MQETVLFEYRSGNLQFVCSSFYNIESPAEMPDRRRYMFSHVVTAGIRGITAYKVVVEADVSDGMPCFSMVGYLSSEVREAQDRVRTALRNAGIHLPVKRITVNLAPADQRKDGSGYDLAIASAILCAMNKIDQRKLDGILMLGELHLDGSIHPVKGVLEIVSRASSFGCHTCILPKQNLKEGSVIGDIRVLGAESLSEIIACFDGSASLESCSINIEEIRKRQEKRDMPDFADLKGQRVLRRSAMIAVAGFHNLLMIGPPGSGKSMTARRIPSILPRTTDEEMLEISRIHSVAGTLRREDGLIAVRPFRAPHHTISPAGLAGGGLWPKPGEISLAHRGVLFLDELPEFRTETLEILRQPMEEGSITISRNSGTCHFPASFLLCASMNPCKCGYYPDRNRCRCSAHDIRRYLSHISQPLLDRIDMCVEAEELSYEQLTEPEAGESSAVIRERVEKAMERQRRRYEGTAVRSNSELSMDRIREACSLQEEEDRLLEQIYHRLKLTGRSYLKVLRVARTIADLEGEEKVTCAHIAEAAGYRMPDLRFWGGEW